MIRQIFQRGDDGLATLGPAVLRKQPKLLILALHTVCKIPADYRLLGMHPQQQLSLDGLEVALDTLSESGYRFVSAAQVAQGLPGGGHYCLITFDDGYHNNLFALPLLKKFLVPALIFVVPHNIETGESFWWDAVYRKGCTRGKSLREMDHFIEEVKRRLAREVRPALTAAGFTATDFQPVGELDRPLNRAELAELARNDLVTLGNHTWGHEILTRCTAEERFDSLQRTQGYLAELTGRPPEWIAYPNGDYQPNLAGEVTRCGLRWGVTLRECPNRLPLSSTQAERLTLGRFLLWGNEDVRVECRRIQLDFSLLAGAKNLQAFWHKLREDARR